MTFRNFILCLSALIALAACGDPNSETPSSTSSPALPMTLEQRGAKLYSRCRSCHTLEQDGRNKVGPNLWAIYGRTSGTHEKYAYSKAMMAREIVWDANTMDAYLKRPADYVPGTKMTFIGLKNQLDRDAIQAYLRAETTP